MFENYTEIIANNPQPILIWSHGFFFALALKRGRIEQILDKALPFTEAGEDTNE